MFSGSVVLKTIPCTVHGSSKQEIEFYHGSCYTEYSVIPCDTAVFLPRTALEYFVQGKFKASEPAFPMSDFRLESSDTASVFIRKYIYEPDNLFFEFCLRVPRSANCFIREKINKKRLKLLQHSG